MKFLLQSCVSWSLISIKTYQSPQYCRLSRMILALAYMLYYLHAAWLQFQRLKQSSIKSTDRKKYVNLTLDISINSTKNYGWLSD